MVKECLYTQELNLSKARLFSIIKKICCLYNEYFGHEEFIVRIIFNNRIEFFKCTSISNRLGFDFQNIPPVDKYSLVIDFGGKCIDSVCDFAVELAMDKDNICNINVYNNFKRKDSLQINDFFKLKLDKILRARRISNTLLDVENCKEYSLLEGYGHVSKPHQELKRSIMDMYKECFSKIPNNKVMVKNEEVSITKEQFEYITDYYADILATIIKVSEKRNVGIVFKDEGLASLAIFSAIKAGFCFVLISPSNPAGRLDYIIHDSQVRVILTDINLDIKDKEVDMISFTLQSCMEKREFKYRSENNINKPFYIIYTSGSTGLPKGVIISQKSLAIIISWFIDYLSLNSRTRSMHILSYTFDFGLFDILSTILCGGLLCCSKLKKSFREICMTINREKINNLCTTPSLFNILANCSVQMPTIRILHFGGEQLRYSNILRYKEMLSSKCRILNGYGPSECTIGNTIYEIPSDYALSDDIPIGFPNGNSGIVVLNKHNNITPLGGIGEICILGDGLGLGFSGSSSALYSYIKIKNSKIRVYRSGDLGYWNHDGSLQFVTRINQDIKINGYRIDFTEIERTIMQFPELKACSCLAISKTESIKILVAFLVCNKDIDITRLRCFLHEYLPGYMMPHKYVVLDQLPLNSSGKIDLNKMKCLI